MGNRQHIVICTFGSLGDIYPYLAVGLQLLDMGFKVTLATSYYHQALIESTGLGFFHVRPDLEQGNELPEKLIRKIMDERKGSEYVLRDLIMPNVQSMYEDYTQAAADASLLITHPLAYGAIAVARQKNLPWVATVLSPCSMWSAYDPPMMPLAPFLPALRRMFGVGATRSIIGLAKKQTYSWAEPYRQLQSQIHLPVQTSNPFFEGQFSPLKNLALFSPLIAPPQPDWPDNCIASGFPFLDEFDTTIDDERLREFLQAGDAPVVFTLGSSAVWDPGAFYVDSVDAVRKLGMRAVLLVGTTPGTRLPAELKDDVIVFEYLAHGKIFPHAAAIVHQGGIGTTAQALRAGRPQIVMPYSHDQFDNANRIEVIGAGTRLARKRYNGATAAGALTKVRQASTVETAKTCGEQIRLERGAQRAAEEIAAVLKTG